jgi:hypothetical protein
MIQIQGLTSSPSQSFSIADPNTGESINCTLRYQPRTQEWYIGLAFRNWEIANLKLTFGPNVLIQYTNSIPFGLSVYTEDRCDPFLINDFVSGRVTLALLTTSEAAYIEDGILAGTITE